VLGLRMKYTHKRGDVYHRDGAQTCRFLGAGECGWAGSTDDRQIDGKVCHGGGLNRYTDHDGSLPTDKVNKKEGTEKTTDQFYHSKDARGKQLLLLTTDASNEEEVRSVDGD